MLASPCQILRNTQSRVYKLFICEIKKLKIIHAILLSIYCDMRHISIKKKYIIIIALLYTRRSSENSLI